MFNFNLRKTLIILFLIVGIVPIAVAGYLFYNNAQGEIENKINKSMAMYGEITDNSLEDFFAEREGEIKVLALNDNIKTSLNKYYSQNLSPEDDDWQYNIHTIDRYLKEFVNQYGYSFAFLTDKNGEVIYSTTEDVPLGTDLSERNYINKSIKGNMNWSELFYSGVINNNAIVLSTPIRENDFEMIVGTANLTLNQSKIDRIVHNSIDTLGDSADAYLIDSEGLLLTNTLIGQYQNDAALKENIDTRAVELLSGPIGNGNYDFSATEQYREYRDVPVLGELAVTKIGDRPAGLIVEIDQSEVFAGINSLRNYLLIIIALVAVSAALIAYFGANRIFNPLEKFQELFAELAMGDLSVGYPMKSVNCSEIMDCGVEDCPDFGKTGVTCWFDVGSYAPEFDNEIYCPKILTGEYDSCEECIVYKKVNENEIKTLGAWFNKLVDKLNNIITDVADIASDLSSSSQELSASSEEISASAEQVGNAIEEVASGAEEQTAQIEETKGSVDNLSNKITNVEEKSDDMDQ
ncbi:MAG TPA: cache domain-containing protein, partial [Halanaerobiales bacterium]|nr:cache domain-containing protein [Halanaerobiales bacterium]